MIEWLESEMWSYNGETVYPKDKIKSLQVPLLEQNLLVLNWDDDKHWLKFAVLEFSHSDADGANVMFSCVFHGEGPSGNLRECRHTYWGDDGYLFYPNGRLITAAFKELSKYFDDLD